MFWEDSDLSYKRFDKLPDLTSYTKLKILHYDGNEFTELSNIIQFNNVSLLSLNVSLNYIITYNIKCNKLLILRSLIFILIYYSSKLRDLTKLLTILRCNNNQLTKFTNLPNSRTSLSCYYNQRRETFCKNKLGK